MGRATLWGLLEGAVSRPWWLLGLCLGVAGCGFSDLKGLLSDTGTALPTEWPDDDTAEVDDTAALEDTAEEDTGSAGDVDGPVMIRQGPGGTAYGIVDFETTSSSVQIDACSQIFAVRVSVDITHTFPADLRITLTAPGDVAVRLFDRDEGTGDGLLASWGTGDLPGTHTPDEPLDVLHGGTGVGSWSLAVEDVRSGAVGQLDGWQLEVRCEPVG